MLNLVGRNKEAIADLERSASLARGFHDRQAEASCLLQLSTVYDSTSDYQDLLETATAERAQIAAKVPEEMLELYTRISRKHPGAVMAEVRDGQCRGCGMRVLPHVVQVLRTETNEEVFRCETCGCILYTLEPIPHAAPAADASVAPADEAAPSK